MDQNVNTERILNGFNVFWWVESGIVFNKPNLLFFLNIYLGVFNIYISRFCLQTNKKRNWKTVVYVKHSFFFKKKV